VRAVDMDTDTDLPAPGRRLPTPLTIYDVARHAGVSTASVSRVLNGHVTPRPETRDRVLRAVSELGFVPNGAARALSSRLKEVVSVVVRRIGFENSDEPEFEDESDNLVFIDMVNRGVEVAAQHHGYDLLLSSVEVNDHAPGGKIAKLAAKSDGIILHDRVLSPSGIVRLADRIPVVTLAALNFGALIGGAIITEQIFQLDGMGNYFIQNLFSQDVYPIMAWLMITAIAIIIFNLIADILYGVLDPRVRYD